MMESSPTSKADRWTVRAETRIHCSAASLLVGRRAARNVPDPVRVNRSVVLVNQQQAVPSGNGLLREVAIIDESIAT